MEQHEKTLTDEKHDSCVNGCSGNAKDAQIEKVRETEVERGADPERAYVPAVDIIDNESDTLLLLDMPGVEDSGVDLTLEKNILTIHAAPAAAAYEGKNLVYSEYGVGDYRRSFSLSEEVDRDGITASLKDGVLKVRLPKMAPVTKKIAVGSH